MEYQNKKDVFLIARVSKLFKDRVLKRAEKLLQSPSDYIRGLIEKDLKKK